MAAGEIKKLQFSDGVTVTAPSELVVAISKLSEFVDDAAYVAAKGSAAAEGDIYANTTNNTIRYNDGTTWSDVFTNPMTEANDVIAGGASGAAERIDTDLLGNVKAKVGTTDLVDGDFSVGSDTITLTGHTLEDKDTCYFTTTGTLPTGLTASTKYYVIDFDTNSIRLALSEADVDSNTFIDITAASGGGTHTIHYSGLRAQPADDENAGTVTREEYTSVDVAPDANFTSGNIICGRVGRLVTIFCDVAIVHPSSSSLVSATALVPAQYRPSADVTNVNVMTSTFLREVQIQATGNILLDYDDWTGGGSLGTQSGRWSVSYIVD